MALTGFNPTATLVAMGVGAAGQRANELSNSGVAANDALGRGIVSGVIEGLTEKIGVDNLYSIVKSNNVKVLADILKQAAAEGTEEGLGSVLNYAADRMAGDNEKFDWNDMAQSVIQGALSGAMFGIGGVATNKAFDAIDNYNANKLKYNDILPKVSDGYLSDVSDTNINIGNKSAMEYVDNYNKRLERTNKINDSKQSQYMKQIYDVMTGNFDDKNVVGLGKTPDILQKYGAKNIEMTMKPSAVRKIAYPTNYLGLKQGHNLGFYALEQLPHSLLIQ